MRIKAGFKKKDALKKLSAALRNAQKTPDRVLKDALREAVIDIHRLAVKGISKRSRGHIETRYKPKREVIVSLTFDPPNTDRGLLVRSIMWEIDEIKMRAAVGSNLLYASFLEFGTRLMGARPWLAPAFHEWMEKKGKKFFREVLKSGFHK